MQILGISPLDKDSTASLYVDGKWKAIAEERLSRIKMHKGFPKRAVKELLKSAGLSPGDIECIVYPFMPWWVESTHMLLGYMRDLPFTLKTGKPWRSKLRHLNEYSVWCKNAILDHYKYHLELKRELRSLGLYQKLVRIEHHASHAAGAYLTSGFEEAIALTLDWYGGGLSGSVNCCSPKGIERLHNFSYPHSMGMFFAQVTSALGFKSSQHEGKIVGLAAYGDSKLLASKLLARFIRKDGDFRYCCGMDSKFSKDLARRFPREHIAAAYQYALEVIVCEIVNHWTQKTGLHDVVLSGGVTANVKMNQRIASLDGVSRVFIHPNMGDGGTSVGAILAYLFEHGMIKSEEWKTCYLGPEYSNIQMKTALQQAGLEPTLSENMAEDVAKALANGKVVARFSGAMEYGPRALGNRSILCSASDPDVNKWLNRGLGRTEFMPFAPVTLFEHCRERYLNINKLSLPARFMTITCDCTDLMQKESPAAVHVDGTARPQIIRRDENSEFYSILEAYYKLTGIPTLINTSFNMHEDPIVCTPKDAVHAFLKGGLDYLSMGPFLVTSNQKTRILKDPCVKVTSHEGKSNHKPVFIITIDTEGDNLWVCPETITTANSRYLPRFQELCEKYQFKPTWLTNYEMAECPVFCEYGRDVLQRETGEIGMHLHAWNSPPITSNDLKSQAYLIEYPENVMRDKIKFITELLEQRFQCKIVSHRAGRWAFNSSYANLLTENRYLIDCSVTPHVSWKSFMGDPKGSGGTDYTNFPSQPYFIDLNKIDREGNSPLLEIPVSIVKKGASSHSVFWLRPDGLNRNSMLEILNQANNEQWPCVEFMLHSSELMPGGSPTFPTEFSIENLYDDLEAIFSKASELFQGATLSEFYDIWVTHCNHTH